MSDGDWTISTSKQSNNGHSNNNKRIYVGNLPRQASKDAILALCQSLAADTSPAGDDDDDNNKNKHAALDIKVEVVSHKTNSHALVQVVDPTVSRSLLNALRGYEYEGRRLTADWERKKPPKKKKASSGWSGGWSGPSVAAATTQPTMPEPTMPPPRSFEEAAERVHAIIEEDQREQASHQGNSIPDPLDTLLSTTAALSVVASAGGFDFSDKSPPDEAGVPPTPAASSTTSNHAPSSRMVTDTPLSSPGFSLFSSGAAGTPFGAMGSATPGTSLADLMADYGEYDPNWQQKQPQVGEASEEAQAEQPESTTPQNQPPSTTNAPSPSPIPTVNRLGMHGKAPFHVDWVSFGFHYGVPSERKNQSSAAGSGYYAQPLPIIDCRVVETIPPHLTWTYDGLSPLVKRLLIEANPSISDNQNKSAATTDQTWYSWTKSFAQQVLECLVEAVEEGGYGYAQPLRVTIFCGSQWGRHRSVAAVEAAAIALRNLLRKQPQPNNNNNSQRTLTVPCSVATRHTHIDKKPLRATTGKKKTNPGNDEDDDEW